jgi:hypothetical protein
MTPDEGIFRITSMIICPSRSAVFKHTHILLDTWPLS